MSGSTISLLLLLVLPILPNLWAIWHIFHHEFPSPQSKAVWLLMAVFLPVLGGVLYLAIGRKKAV